MYARLSSPLPLFSSLSLTSALLFLTIPIACHCAQDKTSLNTLPEKFSTLLCSVWENLSHLSGLKRFRKLLLSTNLKLGYLSGASQNHSIYITVLNFSLCLSFWLNCKYLVNIHIVVSSCLAQWWQTVGNHHTILGMKEWFCKDTNGSHYISQYVELLDKIRIYKILILVFEFLEIFTQHVYFHIFTSTLLFTPTGLLSMFCNSNLFPLQPNIPCTK